MRRAAPVAGRKPANRKRGALNPAAISAAGFSAPRFLFAGFLPATGAARRKALQALDLPWPVVIYEAPHRIAATLADLAQHFGAARELAICRELSKKFEEVARVPLGEAAGWLTARPQREQGEFVLVLAPGEEIAALSVDPDVVLDILLEALSPSEAAKLAARITGAPKNILYRKALDRGK